LLERNHLLEARDQNGNPNSYTYLADLIATLGPPSPEFLTRNPELRDELWGRQGKFRMKTELLLAYPLILIITDKWIPFEPIRKTRNWNFVRKTGDEEAFQFL